MKKSIIYVLIVIAVATIGLFRHYHSISHQETTMTPLMLKNIEALTQVERPCDNYMGYRSWTVNGIGPNKKGFYDCYYVYREGYNPSGKCY